MDLLVHFLGDQEDHISIGSISVSLEGAGLDLQLNVGTFEYLLVCLYLYPSWEYISYRVNLSAWLFGTQSPVLGALSYK